MLSARYYKTQILQIKIMLRPTLDAILNEYVLMAITIYYSMITNTLWLENRDQFKMYYLFLSLGKTYF